MKNYKIFLVIIFLIGNHSVLKAQIESHFTVFGKSLNFEFNRISDRVNGYENQSNASPQQIWYDINHPGNIHAAFVYSSICDNAWADRTTLYFGSTDEGETWFELGQVPVNNGSSGRSGFPTIYGNSLGQAVIINHNNSNSTPTRSKLYIDSAAFAYNIAEYDPMGIPSTTANPIWPRLVVDKDDNIFFISSQIEDGDTTNCYLIFFDNETKMFSGWQPIEGYNRETYALAVSDSGKVGVAWQGNRLTGNQGDIFYMETTNEGITWTPKIKIYDSPDNQDTVKGAFRGISLSFYGEEPCLVFDVSFQSTMYGNSFNDLPCEIHFWSPNVNGGETKILADSSIIPFALGESCIEGAEDFPLCRPVIGRSETRNYLFAAFNSATDSVWNTGATFYCYYFMFSSDGGDSWSQPEKFTPETSPLFDWRYVSIAPINPVISNICKVHFVIQGAAGPGRGCLCWWQAGSSGQFYHINTEIVLTDVKDEQEFYKTFKLEQNYPNPFNPSTKIKFIIPFVETRDRVSVQLKVYDVLGNEIAILVNEEKQPGTYEVKFNIHSEEGRNLSSGIYFYQLQVGNYIETKKMVLLK